MTINIEEAHALAGLTEAERRLAAGDEPTLEPEPAPTPELRQEIHVPLEVDVPPNAREILAEIQRQRDLLAQAFDEGDLTTAEYRQQIDRVAAEQERISWQLRKAELAQDMRATAERASWKREVQDFMTTGPGARIAASQTQMTAFDAIVRQVTADPANQNLSDRAQLERAWRVYQQDTARIGLATDAYETASALGNMGGGYVDTGQFAILDQMAARGDVDGIEKALALMSPAERDRYGF